jgi:hypothetical protein
MLPQSAQNTLVKKFEELKVCKGIYFGSERIGLVREMGDLHEFYDRNLHCTSLRHCFCLRE